MTSQDVNMWADKAVAPKAPRNTEQIKKMLWQKNFVRMRRIQREFRWMQKQMKKMGLNPEDARWLL